MRRLVFVLYLCLAAPALADNPVIRDKFTADPAALVHDGRVYLYTGHDEATPRDRHFVMRDWWCYSSDDMTSWKDEGSPLSVKAFEWARGDAWASQVIERDGKFYWYATVRHRTINGFSIGVAVADKPTGPFRDARGSALVSNDMTRGPLKNGREMDWDDLDPTVIIDDDGQAYLFWGNTQCYYAKLKSNMTELDGPIEKIELPKFTEAPWVHKRNGIYYLSYAHDFPEQIAYATAEKITGPWTFRGVINERIANSPTNHQSIIEFKGKWCFFYHNAALPGGGEHRRSVCVEELLYQPDGSIRPITQDPRGLNMNDTNAALFPLSSVRLLDGGPFAQAQERDRQYILAHDVDRLLAPFRREAGLPAKAQPYGNWESQGLDGHSAGHYLSAVAMMYASTGDAELKRRLDYMVAELAECQRANGNGYVGGVPKSKELWAAVAAGDLKVTGFGLNDRWVPWYNLHKTFAGLRDAHLLAGSEQARRVLVALADWCIDVTAKLSDAQMQEMLRAEHGGMNEVLADVHAMTKNDKYLKAARRFSHRAMLDPLADGRDELTGKHANTQIPKVIGFQRVADLSADRSERERFARAARFFWDTVTRRRSVAIGGNSVNEHFHPPDNFRSMLEDRTGPETCNTYNMLRLTEALFARHPRAEYADYYERALFNHILSTQHPEHGGFVYFTPMRPRHYRVYSQPGKAFWCCVGSGFENHAKYGQFIYARRGDDNLYVNLFIASQLNWDARGLTLKQTTKFPDEPRTQLALGLKSPATFTLYLRHPEWVKPGAMTISVNGRGQEVRATRSSYVEIKREWRDGDVIDIELPMLLSAERLPDQSNHVALKYGPVVLAAATGSEQMPDLRAGEGRGDHIPGGPLLPLHDAPALVTNDPAKIAEHFEAVPGVPLTFRATSADVIRPEQFRDLKLVPFFRLHDARYVLYWPLAAPADYEKQREAAAAAERERLALEAATVDRVAPGQQQSEVDHGFAGEQTNNGTFNDRSWRDARGWFSYQLRVPREGAATLRVTYWGADRDRHFDVLVDGEVVAEVRLDGSRGATFFDVEYPVPGAARAAGKLTLRFQAKPGSIAGGVFDVRVLRGRAAGGADGADGADAAARANLAMVAKVSTSFVSGHETLAAVNDDATPRRSGDTSHGAYGNWPRRGTQWVEYEWPAAVTVNAAEVYWYDDARGVRVPESCRFQYWDGSAWADVRSAVVGLASNRFNRATFEPVKTTRLRLEMTGRGESSTGVLEWRVFDAGGSPEFPPVLDAGVDRVVVQGGKTHLAGSMRTTGKPGQATNLSWSKVSGPGDVVFADAHSLNTSATFSAPGEYALKLEARAGEQTASDTLRVRVEPPTPVAVISAIQATRYRVNSPIWEPRLKALIVNWIPHCVSQNGKPDLKEGGINNIVEAGKRLRGEPSKPHVEYPFSNAWVLNTVEAMCVAQMLDAKGDPEVAAAQQAMRDRLEEWIPLLLAAQEPDGYFQTRFTLGTARERQRGQTPQRWDARLRGEHEGYVAGYFIEAGIAHHLSTDGNDRRLYDAAKKLADCWYDNIGPSPKKSWWDGHQEMEMALFRLARYVDEVEGDGKGRKYAELARFLLDCRGVPARGKEGEYDQSHAPVTQQYAAVGHAVRAVYSYAAMADAAKVSGDVDYQSAVRSIWDNLVNRKYYVTGGIGSGETSEGFGGDYSLPVQGYCESCSGCGMLFFQHRMHALTGHAKYADLYEETLYNAILSDIDLTGENFTYTNSLDTDEARYKWHVCPCCVGNIPRTLLMLPTWTYTRSRDGLYVNLFVGGEMNVGSVAGTKLSISQTTNYPWDGKVSIVVNPEQAKAFKLHVRVPDRSVSEIYAASPEANGLMSLAVNGRRVEQQVVDGYAVIDRTWKAGDRVEFELPMKVQRVRAVEQVAATRGRVALRYGPLIYNFESIDQKLDGAIAADAPLRAEWTPDLLGGVVAIKGAFADDSPLLAIPNYARNNRGGRSIVWVGEARGAE